MDTTKRKTLRDNFLPVLLGLLLFSSAQAQVLQKINGTGSQYKRLQADSSLGIPADTLALFSFQKTSPHIAEKGGVVYLWSVALQKWVALGGGSSSGTVNTGLANRLAYYAANGTTVSTLSAITANRALISDGNGLPTHSTVTSTELGYVAGATANIQAQLDSLKVPVNFITNPGTGVRVLYASDSNEVTARKLNFTGDGVTVDTLSNQINVHIPGGADLSNYATLSQLALKLNISDTANMLGHYFRDAVSLNDTTLGLIRGDGSVKSIAFSFGNPIASLSLTTPNILFANPVSFTNTSGVWSGTLSLNSQTAYTVLGNHTSGSATPTFGKLPVQSINASGSTYNGTKYLRDDGSWASIAGGGTDAAAWHLTGDAATAGSLAGSFLGTTNNVSLRVRANNTEYWRFDSLGRLFMGRGTSSNAISIRAFGASQSSTAGGSADRAIEIGDGTAGTTVSVQIGHFTSVGGTGDVAIGYTANASGGGIAISYGGNSATSAGGIAIGALAVGGSQGTAVGSGATANGGGSTAYGKAASATGSGATALGTTTTASATSTVALGDRASATHNYGIAIGLGAKTTAANQVVIGGHLNGTITEPTDFYFGTGVQGDGTNAYNGGNITFNSGGGIGTDKTGGHFTIAGGKGTGAGTPGDIIFATATAATTGTTLQTLSNRFTIKGTTGYLVASSVNQLPTYADETAATTAGLASGTFYKSSDGIVRIKL